MKPPNSSVCSPASNRSAVTAVACTQKRLSGGHLAGPEARVRTEALIGSFVQSVCTRSACQALGAREEAIDLGDDPIGRLGKMAANAAPSCDDSRLVSTPRSPP